jgi:hypothetical protein
MGSCPSKPGEPVSIGPPSPPPVNGPQSATVSPPARTPALTCLFRIGDLVKRLGRDYGKTGKVTDVIYRAGICSSVTVRYTDDSTETTSPTYFKLLGRESCPFKVGYDVIVKATGEKGYVTEIGFLNELDEEQDKCVSVKVRLTTSEVKQYSPSELKLDRLAILKRFRDRLFAPKVAGPRSPPNSKCGKVVRNWLDSVVRNKAKITFTEFTQIENELTLDELLACLKFFRDEGETVDFDDSTLPGVEPPPAPEPEPEEEEEAEPVPAGPDEGADVNPFYLPPVPQRRPARGPLPAPLVLPRSPNAKCETIFIPWLNGVTNRANITLAEIQNLLQQGMTEEEIDQCTEYARTFDATITLPPKPWNVPAPAPAPAPELLIPPPEVPPRAPEPLLVPPPEVPPPAPEVPPPVPAPQPEVPPPAPAPEPAQITAKRDELLEFIRSKLPATSEFQDLYGIRDVLDKIIEVLGYDPSIAIAEKQSGDRNLRTGSRFVNVEMRSDGTTSWLVTPSVINLPLLNDRIVNQKAGAVTKYKFVIYKPPVAGGKRRTKRKQSKKSRKTHRRK